jgi:hypothetical protein
MNRRLTLTLGAAAGGLLASAILPVGLAFAAPTPADGDPFSDFVTATGNTNPSAATVAATLDGTLHHMYGGTNIDALVDTPSTISSTLPTTDPTSNDVFTDLLPANATSAQTTEAAQLDNYIVNPNDTALIATLNAEADTVTPPTTTPDLDPFADFAALGKGETATLATALDKQLTSLDPGLATSLTVLAGGHGTNDPFTEVLNAGASANTTALDNAVAVDATTAGKLDASVDAGTTTTAAGPPSATGPDAFTIGNFTFDPFTTSGGKETEGFAPLTQGTGAPPFFETGSVADQQFEVFSHTSGTATAPTATQIDTTLTADGVTPGTGDTSLTTIAADLAGNTNTDVFGGHVTGTEVGTALGSSVTLPSGTTDASIAADLNAATASTTPASGTDLGSVTATENVTQVFGATNTGFDITAVNPTSPATTADLPAVGTVYDVANFGGGLQNVYVDVPAAAGSSGTGTVTDELVTPFGDFNISGLFQPFSLTALDPGAAFSTTGSGLSSLLGELGSSTGADVGSSTAGGLGSILTGLGL